jgi:hypothetical protein
MVRPVLAPGSDLVVWAAGRKMAEVGRPGGHVLTAAVVVAFRSDMLTVPDPAQVPSQVGSTPPAPPHSASYCAMNAHEPIHSCV